MSAGISVTPYRNDKFPAHCCGWYFSMGKELEACFRLHWLQQTVKNKKIKKKLKIKVWLLHSPMKCSGSGRPLRGGTLWNCSISGWQVPSAPAWQLCSWHSGQKRAKSHLEHTSRSCSHGGFSKISGVSHVIKVRLSLGNGPVSKALTIPWFGRETFLFFVLAPC